MENKELIELDPFHYHEVLDRTDMIGGIIENNLMNHPVVLQNEELLKKVEFILENFAQLYQDVGLLSYNLFFEDKNNK